MEDDGASPLTSPGFRLDWDVFLSFHGKDTSQTFVEQLHKQLRSKGVRSFRDTEGLKRGDEIQPDLLAAIDDSAAAVAVISPGYADSFWCMEELVRLCDGGKLILPVFYRVDPSDVRHQKGTFRDAFEAHTNSRRHKEDKIESWRRAMKKAGGISGFVVSTEQDEQPVIRIIVELILKLLHNSPMAVAPIIVGLDSRVRQLLGKLDVASDDVKILGLYGMGGIGKSTLAKALYNELVAHFEVRCFVPDVRETSKGDNGLVILQSKLLEILTPGRQPVHDINAGRDAIRAKLQEGRLLLILDDVDDVKQLDAIMGKKEWFHDGSKIIITTRETKVLSSRYVTDRYEVRELSFDDALKLFSYHALKRETPTDTFDDISRKIVSLIGGLPLALEVFGSSLLDKRSTKEWDQALRKLRNNTTGNGHPHGLHGVLRISYDCLDEQKKSIFLDITCFFVQMSMTCQEAVDVLDGCGYDANNSIKDLREKSLIKIISQDRLWVHDQLRDMGRYIVLGENHHDPGRRSRLWNRKEILSVLMDQKGSEKIQGIILDYEAKRLVKDPSGQAISWRNFTRTPNLTTLATFLNEIWKKYVRRMVKQEQGVILDTAYFQPMINLRLLQINQVKLQGKFKSLPQSLKWLQWRGCPLTVVFSDFAPRDLAVLDLSFSSIKQLWADSYSKVAENLKIMIIQGCHNLEAIPDLSQNQKLEKIVLESCTKLTEIHQSVGQLVSLRYLSLRGCSNLVKFPDDVSGLKCLESLCFSECGLLKKLPEKIGLMKSLKELLVDRTAIAELPESLFLLEKLEKVDLTDCSSLQTLPDIIGMLKSLKELILGSTGIVSLPDSIGSLGNLEILSLRRCTSLTTLPVGIGNLTMLKDMSIAGSKVTELPASIRSLRNLRKLAVGNCHFPKDAPDSVEGLISLLDLQLGGKSIMSLPNQIGSLKMLKRLEIGNSPSLETLPESIGNLLNLTTLIISNVGIRQLPESLGYLVDLVHVRLTECGLLRGLPLSFGNLRSLQHLWMEESGVLELPESFGMLSNLVTLRMGKKPQSARSNGVVTLPASFSNLTSLEELNARACYLSGGIPDDFEKLTLLQSLNLGYNNFDSLPSSLEGLSHLKKLYLPHCCNLKSLPPLPLRLEELNIAECLAMETISDLSKLERLQELNMVNCEKVADAPGVESLKSLRRLYLAGCNVCSLAVKRRLSKVLLRNLRVLSMAGGQIPAWLSQQEVTYRSRPNHSIKAVLISVVVSVNNRFPKNLVDLPVLPGIQAKILKLDEPLFTRTLPIRGIPKVNEEHVYFCRFLEYDPMAFTLKDGYRIRVDLNPSRSIPGIELKNCGVFLVFDGDDDYEGDEKALVSESMQSWSEKLARFLNSLPESSSSQSLENTGEGEALL